MILNFLFAKSTCTGLIWARAAGESSGYLRGVFRLAGGDGGMGRESGVGGAEPFNPKDRFRKIQHTQGTRFTT